MTAKKSNDRKKNAEDTLQIKLKKTEKELKEKNDKLLRTCADLQNYQKRMEKELISREEEIKRKYLTELIDLNEILKKAYEDKNPKQGLKKFLKKNIYDILIAWESCLIMGYTMQLQL
jgi:molecular chaperone GrpE